MQQPSEDARASGAGVWIELQAPPMDRGRGIHRGRGAKKRAIPPSHSQSQQQNHPFSESASPSTPEPFVMHQALKMPNTAPQRGGKARQATTSSITPHRASSPSAEQAMRVTTRTDRPARSATVHSSSFGFETPSTAGAILAAAGPARKRSRTFEAHYDGAAADDEAHSKGGHSLRKRARIDYTQEMIDDDLGLPAPKNDPLVVKPYLTPSARGRKRKGCHDDSGEESDDFPSNPKRSRSDKSPAPARTAPTRRRNPSKKLSADVSTYLDQPSDNEVQDTILVSVPTGPGAPSEEESDHSSFREPESQFTFSDESDTARIQVQSPTPQVQLPQSTMEAVSVAGEDEEMADKAPLPQKSDGESHVLPASISLMQATEAHQTLHVPEEERRTGVIVPTIVREPETVASSNFEAQSAEASPGGQRLFQQGQGAATHQVSAGQLFENYESAITSAPAPKLTNDFSTSKGFQDARSGPAVSRSGSIREPKTSGPARLGQLERIYNAETPFASHLKLTPYEDEEVPLPGPYTEWVYPVEPRKEESTSAPTPTLVLSSLERGPAEFEWDARRRLKTNEFFALYCQEKKRRQESGEPLISMIEFNNECARRYKSVHALDASSATPAPTTTGPLASSTVVVERPTDAVITVPVEVETPRDLQVSESRVPTAAASPGPIEDALGEEDVIEDAIEDEQYGEEAIDYQIKPDSPVEPVEVTRYPHKQYMFPKIRDPSDFVEAFDGWQDFPSDRLYETVAAAVETLNTYQQEYDELKKLLDDEENAKRRQANDKTIINWENRQKADEPQHWRRHFDDAIKGPPLFEIRGARAPQAYIDDPILEHQREEDRIMAQAYGFKYNSHPTQVGRQNPEEQRWDMNENRLRKRTEKGAELAEENVVEGKRVRKPRYISDQSKDPSRAGTPTGVFAFVPGRRQRRRPAAANGDGLDGSEQAQPTESFSESPRKGRAARSRGAVLPDGHNQVAPVAASDNNLTEDDEADVDEKPKVLRRRGRGAPALPEPPTSVPTGFGGDVAKPKRVRGGKGQLAHQQGAAEIASLSFYSNASTSVTQPESRPSTASSEGTAHTAETAESTYSLRDKRRRNFAFENDPELEPRPQRRVRGGAAQNQDSVEPKRRGPRRKEHAARPMPTAPPPSGPAPVPYPASPPTLQQPAAASRYHSFAAGPVMADPSNGPQPGAIQAPGRFLHTFNAAPAFPPGAPPPPPPPPAVKKPITKIKLINNGATSQAPSRIPTPANGTSIASPKSWGRRSRGGKSSSSSEAKGGNGVAGNGEFDKPYAEMTKSEKMSWSMRRRWASGEMQGAVEKRRTTLANKKAEKAAISNSNQGPGIADANTMGQLTDSGSAGPSTSNMPAPTHGQAGPGSGLLALPQAPPMMLQPAQAPKGFLQQPPYPYGMPPGGPPGPMH